MQVKFECGDKVKNTMTGVEGVIIAHGNYYGKETDSYLVEYKTKEGALMRDWISENRLIKVIRKDG